MALEDYRKHVANLSVNDKKVRNLHLRKLALGELQGPSTGYPSLDRPWLKFYTEKQMDIPDINKTCYQYVYSENFRYQDQVAIDFLGKKIKYKEVFEQIDNVAKALKQMGIKKGEPVTICMPNTPESAYLFYACSKIGAIADFIDPRENEEGLEVYLNISNTKNIITMDMCIPNFNNLIEKKGIKNVVVVSPVESLPKVVSTGMNLKERITNNKEYNEKQEIVKKWSKFANVMNYSEFIENGKSYVGELEEPYEPNRPVASVHTGGTSGIPKEVLLSNDNINELTNQLIHSDMPFKRDYLSFGVMPEFVGYGLTVGLHTALTVGMRNMMIPKYEPEKIPKMVQKYKPNVLTGSPAHWEIISKSKLMKKNKIDLSFFKSPAEGGDTLNTKLEEKINQSLKEHGCDTKLQKGYGMTENSSVVTVTFNNEVNTIGGVGVPLLKTDICICDEKLNELPYGQIGEICVKSPALMLQYFNNPKETEEVMLEHKDGEKWLHSGDLGYITKDGILYVVGRIKDIVIRYDGIKLYPYNVETILLKNPNVKTVSVVGIKDPEHINGEIPVAFVTLNKEMDEKTAKSELNDFAMKNITAWYLPTDYVILDTLPKTQVGKVNKRQLKQMYQEKNQEKILKK